MTCDELKEMMELYCLGVLEGEEKDELDAHLARNCETCQGNLNGALAMNAALLTFVPEVKPPRRLKRRILAGIGVERSGWGWAAALAAACMLAVAVWVSLEERRRTAELADARRTVIEVSAQRDRLQQALGFLDDPATLPVSFGKGQPAPPRGNVFVNARLGVLLIASNLPPAASGRIYQMWMIPKGGAPRPAGLFQSEAAGTALHILSGPVDAATLGAVAVTLEPEAGSPAPTTTPIIVATVAGL
jgi:anti-sigma-K factor RskA